MTPEEQAKEVQNVLFNNPKSFVSGTRIYISDEFFALRIDVGTQQYNFALPPRVAKLLSHFLSEQVKSFEQQMKRQINVALPAPAETAGEMNNLRKLGFDTQEQFDSSIQQKTDTPEKLE